MYAIRWNISKVALALVTTTMLGACENEPDVMTEDAHRWQNSLSRIEGAVFHREHINLPQDAVMEVQLLDTSIPGAPVTMLSSGPIKPQGHSVYDFSIDVKLSQIEQEKLRNKAYMLRATIHTNGNLMFSSTGFIDAAGRGLKYILVERVPATGIDTSVSQNR
jgi:uncharacterized lipoprotein YbaY